MIVVALLSTCWHQGRGRRNGQTCPSGKLIKVENQAARTPPPPQPWWRWGWNCGFFHLCPHPPNLSLHLPNQKTFWRCSGREFQCSSRNVAARVINALNPKRDTTKELATWLSKRKKWRFHRKFKSCGMRANFESMQCNGLTSSLWVQCKITWFTWSWLTWLWSSSTCARSTLLLSFRHRPVRVQWSSSS